MEHFECSGQSWRFREKICQGRKCRTRHTKKQKQNKENFCFHIYLALNQPLTYRRVNDSRVNLLVRLIIKFKGLFLVLREFENSQQETPRIKRSDKTQPDIFLISRVPPTQSWINCSRSQNYSKRKVREKINSRRKTC